MRLLILAASVAAALAWQCPEQCNCSTGDELEYFCKIKDTKVTFNARINEYVNIKCWGTNFTCSDLPTFNLANNLTLPSLGVTGCSPTILRCVNQMLATTSVATVVLINTTQALVQEDLEGMGEMQSLMIKLGADKTVPVSALNSLPHLQSLRISGTHLRLYSNAFTRSPPLEFLELSTDGITELPENAFNGLTKLTKLAIWGNNIAVIRANSFKGLDSLKSLYLNTNHLSSIEVGTFAHTPKLKSISLFDNQLEELPTGLIHNLPQLENITIKINRIELKIEPQALSNLPSLKNLCLESSRIRKLPEDLLTGSGALETLSLSHNEIASLPPRLFKDQKALQKLDLSSNYIASLPSVVFIPLKQLKSLFLDRNYLEVLPDDLFAGLRNLRYVSIDHNFLTTIGNNTFQGATELNTLSLNYNKLTLKSCVHDNAGDTYCNVEFYSPFNTLTELRTLLLSGNNIDIIFDDWRIVFTKLQELNLSRNSFTQLNMHDVQFLSGNIKVDLRHNHISTVYLYGASTSPTGFQSPNSSILLDDNPLNCDCIIYNLAMRLRGAEPMTAEPKFIVGNARCASPSSLQGQLFKDVSPYDLSCDLEPENCPLNCSTCRDRPAKRQYEWECITIPPIFPDNENEYAISLKLQTVPKYIGNLSVRTLNLSNTGLEEIPFAPSSTVELLDLSNNKIKVVPTEFLNTKTILMLSNNPFDCQCWYSNEISALQRSLFVGDLENLTCSNGDKLVQVDVVALCSTWRAAAVASGTFMVLALFVTVTIITMCRYSHEILVFITSHGLFPCCFIEDLTDADREYDVFVSYAHKDRKFFLELLPKLENDFEQKTCVHYRDWYIGDMIPDQINRSVETSRRTLILLSGNFLESTYANMEFRTAHNLSLKEGKTRVILILLEDVSKHEKMSEELKAYISTNTYLTWDDPKFWERLHRALPRRNNKKFVWPDVFKQAAGKAVTSGLDVHLNSEGQLVNVAVKDV